MALGTVREVLRRLLEALCIVEGVAGEQQRLVVLEVEVLPFTFLHLVRFIPRLVKVSWRMSLQGLSSITTHLEPGLGACHTRVNLVAVCGSEDVPDALEIDCSQGGVNIRAVQDLGPDFDAAWLIVVDGDFVADWLAVFIVQDRLEMGRVGGENLTLDSELVDFGSDKLGDFVSSAVFVDLGTIDQPILNHADFEVVLGTDGVVLWSQVSMSCTTR